MKQAFFSLEPPSNTENDTLVQTTQTNTKNTLQQQATFLVESEINQKNTKCSTDMINKNKPMKKTENVYYFS
jgi:hypothetical protein